MNWRRRRHELQGLDEEIRDHVERETQDNIDRGMTPEAARQEALRKFGNLTRAAEETRAVWRHRWLDHLAQDFRYGARVLRRNPRFAIVVALTLALGIGINTAVFSVINAVLLRPLAHSRPDSLVWVGDHDPNLKREYVNLADFFEWRKRATSYDGMAAFGYLQAALELNHRATQVNAVYTAADFWRILEARPALGRLCASDETSCAVLAWDLFEREYGADPHLIGGAISVNGRPARIAAVLPASFRLQLPMWWVKDNPQPVEAFVSLPPPRERMAQSGQMFALLKPGVRPEQAQTELVALHQRLLEQGGRRALMTGLRVQSLQEKLAGNSGRTLAILMAAGILVLLIACVNVTSLLLARSTARSREVAIRSAIGAARLRVFRQLLVENLLLTLCGGVAGLLLARWSIAALVRISPFAIPRLSETTVDARVAVFALALCMLAAILFGCVSAISCWRADLQDALKENARAGGGLLGPRTRRFLMATELALAIVLLTAAGLMWKSFLRMNQHPAGFEPEKIVTMRVRLAGPQYQSDAQNDAHVRDILRTVESERTLQPAGISSWVLYANAPEFPIRPGLAVTQVIRVNATSPGYLRALGMRLVRGRWLGDDDSGVLLNESLAHKIFGDSDAIGQRVAIPRPATVVGVVTDLKYERLDEAVAPEAYVAWQRIPPRFNLSIAARAAGDPAVLARALARRIADLDRSQPVFAVQTMEQSLTDALAARRFNLFLLGAFAVVALTLALVGIYGVMAYSVSERTREMGVRIALGARRGQVIGMVASEAALVSGVGIAVGLLVALPSAQALSTLLYGVSPNDPMVFAGVAIALGLTALGACVGPAVRASATDPSIALRYE